MSIAPRGEIPLPHLRGHRKDAPARLAALDHDRAVEDRRSATSGWHHQEHAVELAAMESRDMEQLVTIVRLNQGSRLRIDERTNGGGQQALGWC